MVGHHRLRGGDAEPMPELPEVETVMRGLATVLQGRVIRAAAISRPDLRWHDLRHTGATLAAQTGASIRDLQHRMGHSTTAAALNYQHASAEQDRTIAERLDQLAMSERSGNVVPLRPTQLARTDRQETHA